MPGVPSKGRYFNELMAKINYIYMFYGVNEGIFLGGVQKELISLMSQCTGTDNFGEYPPK